MQIPNRKLLNMYQKKKITTWRQFGKLVRSNGCQLLKKLDQFQNSILVTGCQRSGTTILSRVITLSDEMVNYWFGKDDELDAALILSGEVPHTPIGRYCFQTTYLNECYEEYFNHIGNYKMIWVLRNPFSVVYSLIYNWKRWPLNELFHACGYQFLSPQMSERYRRFGLIGVPRLIKACLSYNGKVSQLFEIKNKLNNNRIMVVEYDELVNNVERQLSNIFRFLDLQYQSVYCERFNKKSTKKKYRLSEKQHEQVHSICNSYYEKAKLLI